MTSSTKPEVHKVLHFGKRRIESRPRAICTEVGRVFLEISNRTDTLSAIIYIYYCWRVRRSDYMVLIEFYCSALIKQLSLPTPTAPSGVRNLVQWNAGASRHRHRPHCNVGERLSRSIIYSQKNARNQWERILLANVRPWTMRPEAYSPTPPPAAVVMPR